MDALVGAGGWGYFSGGLEAYARGFRFVEVNVSFYRRIPEATARRWRSRVPDDFVFAIKSNQAITHTDRLRASARPGGILPRPEDRLYSAVPVPHPRDPTRPP